MPQARVDQFVQSLRLRQAESSENHAPVATENQTAAPKKHPPIFDPQMLSKLGRLELIASTVVDGLLSGKHRSTHKGGCTDFAEFRPYTRGDDIRQLDWRQFAKSDRYFVKQFDDETNLQALLVVDASGSMQFGMSTISKWRYAQMTAACLGHLLLRQRDSVGLAVLGNKRSDYVRPLPRASHLARVLQVLQQAQPAGKADLGQQLMELAGRLKRRGMVVLLSDGFGDVPRLKHALEQFRARGHDVLVFQVLAPEELTFPFRRDAIFQGLERQGRLQVNPNVLRKEYLSQFQHFLDHLRDAIVDIGADLATLTTDQDLGEALAHFLHRRVAMKTNTTLRSRA